ncbi:hypothetical protein ACO2Q9_03320 [Variovorax sp. VNK109]|jgi:hypothetical protein|uniref:hypothetical protein n=1 Tax=Variovorax sp. VNK109 TaxID=3400919 RepID=UPI003C1176BE
MDNRHASTIHAIATSALLATLLMPAMASAQNAADNASRPIGSGFGDGTSLNTNNSGISTPGGAAASDTTSTSSSMPSQWVTPNGVVIIQGGRRPRGENRLPASPQGSVATPMGSMNSGVPTGALGGGVPGASSRTDAPVRAGGSVIAQ